MTNILTTSISEIKSYNPCASGYRNLLSYRIYHYPEQASNTKFPLLECLDSNSVSDVLWLIGKRKKEIKIAVVFAKKCADSVKDLNNKYAEAANAYAEVANAAYANAAAYAYANDDAYAAAYAAAYANAATVAATYAATAADDDAAYTKQAQLNKQLLIKTIIAYQNGEI